MGKKERVILTLLLFVGALISSYFALQTLIKYEIQEKVNRTLDKFPGSVSYTQLDYSLLKNEITIKNLKLSFQNYKAEIGKISVKLPYTISKIPPNLTLTVANAQLSTNLPYVKELLSLANYNANTLTFNAVVMYSISGKNISASLSAECKKLGSINLGTRLIGNVSVPSKLKLKRLELTYKDRGLVKGFLYKQAQLSGERPDTFKRELISSLKTKLPEPLFKPLSEFIENPQCIHLSAIADPPLMLHEIATLVRSNTPLEKISKRLNIKLSICD